jgi:hypothetical protein
VLVGSCDWDPPVDPPGWLEQLDWPIVLVTTSSEFENDTRLVHVALEVLATEPVAVVATLPTGDPAHVRTPANARVERFIPHAPVLTTRPAPSPTAAWASRKRRSPTACRSASSPSGGTSWKSLGGWRSPAQAPSCSPKRLRPDRLRAKVHEAIRLREGAKHVQQASPPGK